MVSHEATAEADQTDQEAEAEAEADQTDQARLLQPSSLRRLALRRQLQ